MTRYAIVEAPSHLGLHAAGVEGTPSALLRAGLAKRLNARLAARLPVPPFDPRIDPETRMLNPTQLRDYSSLLADAVGTTLDHGDFPIVVGGDCSILLGNALALRRRGRYGLLFIDGHADFYQRVAEPTGEVASMDLALVTGRGSWRTLWRLERRADAGQIRLTGPDVFPRHDDIGIGDPDRGGPSARSRS